MKKQSSLLTVIFITVTSLVACAAPQQPLSVHTTPGQIQRPSGCVMQAGQCKPIHTLHT